MDNIDIRDGWKIVESLTIYQKEMICILSQVAGMRLYSTWDCHRHPYISYHRSLGVSGYWHVCLPEIGYEELLKELKRIINET